MPMFAPLQAQPEMARPIKRTAGLLRSTARPAVQHAPLAPNQLRLQAKLTIGEPNDPLEQEADRVAETVMRMPDNTAGAGVLTDYGRRGGGRMNRQQRIQRNCAQCEEEAVQRKVGTSALFGSPVADISRFFATSDGTSHVPQRGFGAPPNPFQLAGRAALEEQVQRARTHGGEAFPASTRSFMEPRFGADFAGVRVHRDANASALAKGVSARAFTIGRDMFFRHGEFRPETDDGRRLIAHELTHVLQQSAGKLGHVQRQADLSVAHAAMPAVDENAAVRDGIPAEKWSEIVEHQYRVRGDHVRAAAIRACRIRGAEACAKLLTSAETFALFNLAKASNGSRPAILAGIGAAAPQLLPRLQPPPTLRLVPPLEPGAVPGIGAGAIGPIIVVAVLVATALELWDFSRFQAELRNQGFVILEDPLALCVGGCHLPSRPESIFEKLPSDLLFSPTQGMEEFAELFGSTNAPKPTPPTVTAVPAPVAPRTRRNPNQTCEDSVLDRLQAEKDRICGSILGESCSPSKVSPKRLARRPCSEIRARIQAIRDCMRARQQIQDECFGGAPDKAHQNAMSELQRGLEACLLLAATNCKPGHPMAEL